MYTYRSSLGDALLTQEPRTQPRLDVHGNYIDPSAGESKTVPTKRTRITVSKVVYKGERVEKKSHA